MTFLLKVKAKRRNSTDIILTGMEDKEKRKQNKQKKKEKKQRRTKINNEKQTKKRLPNILVVGWGGGKEQTDNVVGLRMINADICAPAVYTTT